MNIIINIKTLRKALHNNEVRNSGPEIKIAAQYAHVTYNRTDKTVWSYGILWRNKNGLSCNVKCYVNTFGYVVWRCDWIVIFVWNVFVDVFGEGVPMFFVKWFLCALLDDC